MQNDMRDRLINLLNVAVGDSNLTDNEVKIVADYLIANGVIVPAIRCKDCKFYEKVEYYHPTEKASKNVCRLIKRQMQPDDYCSYAEKEDEEK